MDLVQRCLNGDREAFAELVELYEGALLAHAHRLCANALEAEELAQETFVRAYRSLDQLRDADQLVGWLKGICRNIHRQRRRDRSRDPVSLGDREVEGRAAGAGEWWGGLSAAELFDIVSGELHAMPEPDQVVLTLRHYRGLPVKEIAKRLDLSVSAVTMRLSRAHRKLREALSRQLSLLDEESP